MYRNGQEVYSTAGTGIPLTGDAHVGIGRVIGDVTEYFSGLIDNVRIYNYALTPAQIQAIYNAKQ